MFVVMGILIGYSFTIQTAAVAMHVKMKSPSKILSYGCNECSVEDGKFVCNDDESAIKCFWSCNITNNRDKFDFDKNLENMAYKLGDKLAEHGILGPEKYQDFHEGIYGDSSDLSDFVVDAPNAYITISMDEIREMLYKIISEKLKETYQDVSEFQDIKEVYDKIENVGDMEDSEKVILFDKLIHLQHVSGSVLDVNISDLREEFEKEIE